MAEFWLNVMGSTAVASLVVANVIAYEQLQLLAGNPKKQKKPPKSKRHRAPP